VCLYVQYCHSRDSKFPIRIKKRESPDFKIQIGESVIGLEHVRASCQALTYALSKEDWAQGSMIAIPACEHIAPSRKSIEKVIRKDGGMLPSHGWGDWGKGKFLIEAILNSINEKTKKLYEVRIINALSI